MRREGVMGKECQQRQRLGMDKNNAGAIVNSIELNLFIDLLSIQENNP